MSDLNLEILSRIKLGLKYSLVEESCSGMMSYEKNISSAARRDLSSYSDSSFDKN